MEIISTQEIQMAELLKIQTQANKRIERISNNIIFFFWIAVLGIIGWIITGLMMMGTLASAFN